jgi:hypothetical protein
MLEAAENFLLVMMDPAASGGKCPNHAVLSFASLTRGLLLGFGFGLGLRRV